MTALYFDDFTVGDTFTTGARTVTEADVVAFAGVSGDFNPLHTDAVAAARSPFGSRVAHGLLVLAISSGLTLQTGLFSGTSLGLLGLDDWRFVGPVRFGDTIRVRMTVDEARLTSKGNRGIIRVRHEIVNQEDTVVQEGIQVVLMATRESGGL